MEHPPERSKRLHNFTLPYLRWGQQRFLRCVNPPSHSHHRSPHFPSSSSSPSPSPSPDHAAHRSVSVAGVVAAAARPWNLRTRRSACSEPGDESPAAKAKIVGTEIGVKRGVDEEMDKDEKLKFSVSLLKTEIEEDFSTMIGKRPPRRPKKRPRIVQNNLNTIFPGLWLSEEVTTDSYNVEVVKSMFHVLVPPCQERAGLDKLLYTTLHISQVKMVSLWSVNLQMFQTRTHGISSQQLIFTHLSSSLICRSTNNHILFPDSPVSIDA